MNKVFILDLQEEYLFNAQQYLKQIPYILIKLQNNSSNKSAKLFSKSSFICAVS